MRIKEIALKNFAMKNNIAFEGSLDYIMLSKVYISNSKGYKYLQADL